MKKKIITLIFFINISLFAGWEKLKSNTSEWLTDVYFVDDSIGYAVGTNGTIIKTVDGGDNWSDISIKIPEWLLSLYFFDKNHGFIVGTNSIIISTADGGMSWKYQYLPYKVNFHGIFFSDRNNGWIVGGTPEGYGILLKTTDSGTTWIPVITDLPVELLGISVCSSNNSYVIGRNGTFLKSNNSDYSWSVNNILNFVFQDVTCNGDDIWLVGDHGIILKSTDKGYSWTFFPKITDNHLFKIRFNGNKGIIVGGSGSGYYSYSSIIMETDDGGNNWTLTQIESWPKLYSVAFPSLNRAYAVGYDGIILRYSPQITDITNNDVPHQFLLSQNYPNPFNIETVINYSLPKNGYVSLKVYDILGCEVTSLVNEYKSAGTYQIKFNGKSVADHSDLQSGVYFYKLTFEGINIIKKMILVK